MGSLHTLATAGIDAAATDLAPEKQINATNERGAGKKSGRKSRMNNGKRHVTLTPKGGRLVGQSLCVRVTLQGVPEHKPHADRGGVHVDR